MAEELSQEGREKIMGLLAQGLKINAIKVCREETGMGLAEAKEFVESLAVSDLGEKITTQSNLSSEDLSPEKSEEISNLLAHGSKIKAIKVYRDATGKGLKESKDLIDKLCKELAEKDPKKFARIAATQGGGCASFLIVFLFFLATVW